MKRSLHIALAFLIATLIVTQAQAQRRQKVIFLQSYNNAPYHFGYLIGVNFMDYSLHLNENYQNAIHPKNEFPDGQDASFQGDDLDHFQILNVESRAKPGFSVGVIGDLKLSEYFNLRFSPTLSLSSKYVTYTTMLYDASGNIIPISYYENGQQYTKETKEITSDDQLATFLEFPIHIKFRSKRYNNIGAYIIAGANPKLYLASRKTKIGSDGNPALLQTNRGDVAVEVGAGFDIFNQWFKMGVELKFSYGMINVMKDDVLSMGYIYNSPLNSVRNKQLQLSFTFE